MTAALVALVVVLAIVAAGAIVYGLRASKQNGLRNAKELEDLRAQRVQIEGERRAIGLEAKAEALIS